MSGYDRIQDYYQLDTLEHPKYPIGVKINVMINNELYQAQVTNHTNRAGVLSYDIIVISSGIVKSGTETWVWPEQIIVKQ